MRHARDSIADLWRDRTPCHGERQWPVRIDEQPCEEPDRRVPSSCLLCAELHVCRTVPVETAEALRDPELLITNCLTREAMRHDNELQRRLISTQIKHRAPYALVVPQQDDPL